MDWGTIETKNTGTFILCTIAMIAIYPLLIVAHIYDDLKRRFKKREPYVFIDDSPFVPDKDYTGAYDVPDGYTQKVFDFDYGMLEKFYKKYRDENLDEALDFYKKHNKRFN